jgi:penicillin-binding protein 1C
MPWSAACRQLDLHHTARATSRSLRVTGIDDGSVVRPVPGATSAEIRVQALGTREPITWLLDGRWVGTTAAGARGDALRLRLDQQGEHALTAIDARGRYDRVVFVVK